MRFASPRGRLLLPLLAVVLLVTSCTRRSPHPQHWRVDAKNLHALAAWNAKNLPLMPEDLSREYLLALHRLDQDNVRKTDLASSPPKDPYDPLCVKVRGLTVRQIVLNGYTARLSALHRKMSLETHNLAMNISRFDEAPNVKTYERFVGFQQGVIASYEEARVRLEHARAAFAEMYP